MSQRGLRPEAQESWTGPIGIRRKIANIVTLSILLIFGTTFTLPAQETTPAATTTSPAISLQVDGSICLLPGETGTVQSVLNNAGVTLKGYDIVEPSLNTTVTPGMKIVVSRVVADWFTVPYTNEAPVEIRADDSQVQGVTNTIQQGQAEVGETQWILWKKDGQETARWFQGKKVIATASPTIITRGTQPSRSGANVRKVLYMEATAYTPWDPGCYGKTCTGDIARRGVIAVDPRVIPLGTRVYVEGYGMAVALDTGGAIKGNIIDVCVDTNAEANRWGRQHDVAVEIIE
ncbi:MAG: 3D domain-containing protein [bacterium]